MLVFFYYHNGIPEAENFIKKKKCTMCGDTDLYSQDSGAEVGTFRQVQGQFSLVCRVSFRPTRGTW